MSEVVSIILLVAVLGLFFFLRRKGILPGWGRDPQARGACPLNKPDDKPKP